MSVNTFDDVQDPAVKRLVAEAEKYYQEGETAHLAGNIGEARTRFDQAVDVVLESGLSLRTHPELQSYFRVLVAKINRLQEQAIASGQGVVQQNYDVSPLEELADVQLNKEDLAAGNDENIRAELDFKYTPTQEVRQFIHYFSQGKGRITMETGLRRSGRYLSLARRIFRDEGVPLDLVWLAQAESNWLPHARSWAGAQGMWQFVAFTGMKYGLRQNPWLDERYGIEQPTKAAARYLKFLYNRYLDWQLAMAAYNCGEGVIDRAIAVSGYSDFWYLHRTSLLPSETRNYVPIILAIIVIAKDPGKYGFTRITPEPELAYDTVNLRGPTDLRLVAEIADAPLDLILELNPELRKGITPPGMEFGLRLPVGARPTFESVIAKIPVSERSSWRVHTVAEGETMESIAEKHGLSGRELATANEILPASPVELGSRLIIPTRLVRAPLKGNTLPAWNGGKVQLAVRRSSFQRITVRPGDTISRIAARYGLSAKEIARINHIRADSKLRSGQQITLNLPARQTKSGASQGRKGSGAHPPQYIRRRMAYKVRKGESLSMIASRYGVTVSDIRRWNHLSGTQLHREQVLTLQPSR